jgi:type I restriction modification DNA specificity domain protein
MRRYDSYKDSGVEWLGEVPSHWNLIPNKYIFKLRKNVVGKRSNEYDLLSLSLKGVIKRDMENPEGKFPAEFDTYQEVKEGDFIFCLFDVEETPRTVGLSSYRGMITGTYTIFETNNVDKKFIYYFYLNLDSDKRLKPLYKGLRNTISKETFFSFNTFIPPLSEQQKIAQFLDDKTAKIDQAVDWAEKQIALLKEHKQILIQNAVTRGLNPDVPLKDSGVEWIGQVPEHWDVKKLKFVSKINQHTLSENTNGNLSIKYVDIGSVSFENGIEKVENFSFKNAPSRARRLVNKGDIVVSTVRTYLKAITMVKEEYQDCIFSTGFAVVTSNECLEDSFFELYAKSDAFTEQVSVFSKGMSYPAINSTDLSNLWITVPPLSEQQKIADYLGTQTAKIDQAIALKTDHIEKLKEYKSVLINNVVTGKVQV